MESAFKALKSHLQDTEPLLKLLETHIYKPFVEEAPTMGLDHKRLVVSENQTLFDIVRDAVIEDEEAN